MCPDKSFLRSGSRSAYELYPVTSDPQAGNVPQFKTLHLRVRVTGRPVLVAPEILEARKGRSFLRRRPGIPINSISDLRSVMFPTGDEMIIGECGGCELYLCFTVSACSINHPIPTCELSRNLLPRLHHYTVSPRTSSFLVTFPLESDSHYLNTDP